MVSLFEYFFEEIGYLRKKMHEKETQILRLYDPEILKLSERLDRKLNNFQRLWQLASPEGMEQILLSHEQLILQHQNKIMSFEYSVFKTFVNFFRTTLDDVHERSDICTEAIDHDVRLFLAGINESDESILSRFVLTYEGTILSEKEAKSFIEFVRNQIT